MFQLLKNKLKDQRGLTLIELLAVIVILGIIAAIAVPSILGLIDNSKKDAQVANAQQMVNAARNAVAGNDVTWVASATAGTSTADLTIGDLVTKGYLENFKNPVDKADYNNTASKVVVTKTGTAITYAVTLKQTGTNGTVYFDSKAPNELTRGNVGQ